MDPDGKKETHNRQEIIRVFYDDYTPEKFTVRLTSGREINLFKVGENQNEIFFREHLDKPDEIRIKRTDILFVTGMKPSGLAGHYESGKIYLVWNPPYSEPLNYRVYIKLNNGDWKHIATTGDNDYVIDDIKAGGIYEINITAVDAAGYESLHCKSVNVDVSREIIIPRIFLDSRVGDENNRLSVAIRSGKSKKVPRESKTALYRITASGISFDRYIDETADISGLGGFEVNRYYARTVDSDGNLSAPSNIIDVKRISRSFVTGELLYAMPLGDFSRICQWGTGLQASYYITDFFINDIDLSFDTGLLYFSGAADSPRIDMALMVPFTCTLHWLFYRTGQFSLELFLGGGIFYSTIFTNNERLDPGKSIDYSAGSSFEPAAKGGLQFSYTLSPEITPYVAAGYTYLYEELSVSFITFSAGVKYVF